MTKGTETIMRIDKDLVKRLKKIKLIDQERLQDVVKRLLKNRR